MLSKENALIRNGIISAMRRYFSRCSIRRRVLEAGVHPTLKGPRGGKVYTCNICGDVVPSSRIEVDHIDPVVPVDRKQVDMSLDEYADRLFWCDESNFQRLCIDCHKEKSKKEKKDRASYKRENK